MPPRWGSDDVFEGHVFYQDVAPMELGRKAPSGKRQAASAGQVEERPVGCEVARVSPSFPTDRLGFAGSYAFPKHAPCITRPSRGTDQRPFQVDESQRVGPRNTSLGQHPRFLVFFPLI